VGLQAAAQQRLNPIPNGGIVAFTDQDSADKSRNRVTLVKAGVAALGTIAVPRGGGCGHNLFSVGMDGNNYGNKRLHCQRHFP
jgi:hypothetical protein